MIFSLPLESLPEDLDPEPGMEIGFHSGDEELVVRITEVNESQVVLDGNHPLAGQQLFFDLELISVK